MWYNIDIKTKEECVMYVNKIKAMRKEKEMTLYILAKLSGVSVAYLSRLENERRKNPSIDIMEKVAEALGKSVVEVFF
jgi:transcriptional regulator with XRE-family HTH domain